MSICVWVFETTWPPSKVNYTMYDFLNAVPIVEHLKCQRFKYPRTGISNVQLNPWELKCHLLRISSALAIFG